MTWRVKYQPIEGQGWIELPLVGATDDSAWQQFTAWRMLHSVGYHAVMVFRG